MRGWVGNERLCCNLHPTILTIHLSETSLAHIHRDVTEHARGEERTETSCNGV